MSQQIPPLWDFALRLYNQNGVSDDCIRWQDEYGINVCVLLALCWSDTYQLGAEAEATAQAAQPWTDSAVIPLRNLRRQLKQQVYFVELSGQQESFRDHIKQLEIASEKLLLNALEHHIGTKGSPQKQNAALSYLDKHGVSFADQDRLVQRLTEWAN